MAKTVYTLRMERIEDGWWFGRITELQGVHTDGRTIAAVRRRIREALDAAEAKNAQTAELVEEFALPSRVLARARHAKAARDRATRTREQAESAQAKAREAVRVAVDELKALGMSSRDAATFLGLSHERVRQIGNST